VNELRFEGRVAVVTGAGRGLGRAYALLLAERGTAVVVNDLGSAVDGAGSDEGPAADVVAEIVAAGGQARADTSDVADEAGARAMVDAAVDGFGRIDIVVNNAGIMRWAGPAKLTADDLAAHLDVHVGGTFNTVKAAWPHLVEQGHGRIVNTTSAGLFGLSANTAYATAKGGVIGLTRSLAVAGRKHGITANLIAPAAMTRMAGPASADDDPAARAMAEAMAPELAAPMVAYLAHDDCPVSGEAYAAGAGRFARIFIAMTPGYVTEGGPPTVEDLAEHWVAVGAEPGYAVPTDLEDWSATFLSHLHPQEPA